MVRVATFVLGGLLLLTAAAALPSFVAVPPLPSPYPRVACVDFEDARAKERGSSTRVVVVVPPGAWGTCAHLAKPALTGDGLGVAERSTILVEIDERGATRGLETCLGCDIVRPPSSGRTIALALRHGGPPLLCLGGLALLALASRRRSGKTPPVHEAPRIAEPELAPLAIAHVELTAVDEDAPRRVAGPFVWLERGELKSGPTPPNGPHLRLGPASRAFRQGSAPWPRLVGPGRVSSLPVPPGDEAPVASGDVLRIGAGPPLRLTLPDIEVPPLRLRLAERGHRLGAAIVRRPAFVPLVAALAVLSLAALIAASLAEQVIHVALVSGALTALGALRAFGWRTTSGVLEATDGALVHHLEGHSPRALVGLRVAIRGPGEAEVIARAADGGEFVLEEVGPHRRGPEALALAEQWIAEAQQLASRD